MFDTAASLINIDYLVRSLKRFPKGAKLGYLATLNEPTLVQVFDQYDIARTDRSCERTVATGDGIPAALSAIAYATGCRIEMDADPMFYGHLTVWLVPKASALHYELPYDPREDADSEVGPEEDE